MVIAIFAATSMSIARDQILIGAAVVSFVIRKNGIPFGMSCLWTTCFTSEQDKTISRVRKLKQIARIITAGFDSNEMTGTVCLHKGNEKMFLYPKKECESNCKIHDFETKRLQVYRVLPG